MINPLLTEGAKVAYINDHGWTERAYVVQQYQSVLGIWCVELHTGIRLPIHKVWAIKC